MGFGRWIEFEAVGVWLDKLLFGLLIPLLRLYIMKSEFPLQSLELCIFHGVCTAGKRNSLELLLWFQTGLETVLSILTAA